MTDQLINPSILDNLPEVVSLYEIDMGPLIKPGAFLDYKNDTTRTIGETRLGGAPDIPKDFKFNFSKIDAHDSHLYAQINMAEIPAEVRKPEWPTTGMLWVFFNPYGDYDVECIFKPGDVSTFEWERQVSFGPKVEWKLLDTVQFCREETLPALWFQEDECKAYDEWVHSVRDHFRGYERTQIGGFHEPIQDTALEDHIFMALENQYFGDAGAIYVFYKDGEFTGWATTH